MDIVAGPKLRIGRYVVSLAVTLWCVAVPVLHVPSILGGYLPVAQGLSITLMFVLLLFFLTPRRDSEGVIKLYDLIPFILALPALVVTAFFYDIIEAYEMEAILDDKGVFLALSVAIALLFAAWRVTSAAFTCLLLFILLAVRFQSHLPGLLHGRGYQFDRLGYAFYVGSEGIYGIPFNIAGTILIVFIVFGRLFQQAGGGEWFLNLASALLGKAKGGIAKASVMASFFFGMISGSPAANTATTGAITIPAMKKSGYSPHLAGAIEATASTGGQIMPPVMGAIAFIMAEWLAVPYHQVVFAAAIPATLYFVMVFAGIHFEAMKSNRSAALTGQTASLSSIGRTLLEGWFYIIPLAILIGLLLIYRTNPDRAGLIAILALIGVSFLSKDREKWLYPKKIIDSIFNGLESWLMVAIVTAAVGMMVGSLSLSGLGIKFSSFIVDLTNGRLLLILLAVAIGSFVLGFGLDSIPMYITMTILTAPALLKIGVPDIAAHLFVIYWGMTSFITPPVCIAVYVACAISKGNIWRTGGNAIRLGAGFYIIPFAFVLSPALLLIGTPWEIVLASMTALVGGISIASGLWGYLVIEMHWVLRALHVICGAIVILRDWRLELAGFVPIGLSVLWQIWESRKNAKVTSPATLQSSSTG